MYITRLDLKGFPAGVYHETKLPLSMDEGTLCSSRLAANPIVYIDSMNLPFCRSCQRAKEYARNPMHSQLMVGGRKSMTNGRSFGHEVLSITEFGDRELEWMKCQTSGDAVRRFIRDTWSMSPAGRRHSEERARLARIENERRAAEHYDRALANPIWVTTRARNYRHILTGGRYFDRDEAYKAIACPNQITVHPCNDEELRLPVCPFCAEKQKPVLDWDELHLPDGRVLPRP